MNEVKNLWPEDLFKENGHKNPSIILKKQADFFNKMTKNILVAEVVPRVLIAEHNKNDVIPKMMHLFRITAPFVDNFYFDLAKFKYKTGFSYPIWVEVPILKHTHDIKNNYEFEEMLQDLFREDKVVDIIQGLMIQSKSIAA